MVDGDLWELSRISEYHIHTFTQAMSYEGEDVAEACTLLELRNVYYNSEEYYYKSQVYLNYSPGSIDTYCKCKKSKRAVIIGDRICSGLLYESYVMIKDS